MLWEVEVRPRGEDSELRRLTAEVLALPGNIPPITAMARAYLLGGAYTRSEVERIARDLLVDATVETASTRTPGEDPEHATAFVVNVLFKPGVMDPAAESVSQAIEDLGLPAGKVRSVRRYEFGRPLDCKQLEIVAAKVLANDAIEHVVAGPLPPEAWGGEGAPYKFQRIDVPIRTMTDAELQKLSREGQLHLSLVEMQTIRDHFSELGRDATDAELETLAQTWSEHCSHKTLKGKVDFDGPDGRVLYDNLLKQTIFGATQEIRQRLGDSDWCVSVFADNAGVVRFDDHHHVCFKVETHNHPSAIEPYGGANTGLGGVIRDVLGTGLGGKPICNTDVFCFGPPDYPADRVPSGALHPRRVMRGVVSGVRDYGNRMGIPTVNGAICFDERYLGNPLVYCGTVGLIPVGMEHKEVRPGDLIVAVGGRTGRDGIHGATFSSTQLTHESEALSGGAVQIGNAITEKKVLDVLLAARDRRLYRAITDCGAGGFSSAVGEMGAEIGAEVHLERAPLKYEGLSYCEIWISEAQERMVLAVPPGRWEELRALCASEGVEATVLGTFQPTGRLQLFYQGQQVADLDLDFLHNGRPPVIRKASWRTPARPAEPARTFQHQRDFSPDLLKILSSLNVCSKEWVIRQYDHEVQGGSVLKPLVGKNNDGPGDAAVIAPVLGSTRGLAIGCGINPRLGDLDPYWMAASAIDEAVRNVVAVGGDPSRIALLDNFCWGNTDRPETLGSLVRAAEACRDFAVAYGTPFISGKDSLNNEFRAGDVHLTIPPTLLISALAIVPDVRRCVSMDFKQAGNPVYLLGETREELGGSHFHLIHDLKGGDVPRVNPTLAPRVFRQLHAAISQELIAACHDPSEGGLAVAVAEMCFAGSLGLEFNLGSYSSLPAAAALFAESNTRFVLEVKASEEQRFLQLVEGLPCHKLGHVQAEPRLQVRTGDRSELLLVDATVSAMKAAWQEPLRW